MDLRRSLQAQESESVSMGTQAGTVPYMDGAKTEAETELDQEVQETESHIRRKLIEIHSRYVYVLYYVMMMYVCGLSIDLEYVVHYVFSTTCAL